MRMARVCSVMKQMEADRQLRQPGRFGGDRRPSVGCSMRPPTNQRGILRAYESLRGPAKSGAEPRKVREGTSTQPRQRRGREFRR